MELTYMNQLQNWREINKRGKGISEEEISKIEIKYNITLPQSYKEYLILSGVYCIPIVQGHRFEYIERKQEDAQYFLKEYKLKYLIKKPFWVIADFEDCFWYFHLDEGENPPIYRLDCENYGDSEDDDKYTFGVVANSFQEWIEKAIENYEINQQFEE